MVTSREDARAFGKHGKAMRWHVVALHYDGLSSRQIAETFPLANGRPLVSHQTAARIVRIFEETGGVTTLSRGRRLRAGTMNPADWRYLVAALDTRPDMYLKEMQEYIQIFGGRLYPISTLCETLRRNGYTLRKLRMLCEKRDFDEERTFIEAYSQLPASYFLWADETRKDPRGLHHRRGRGIRGTRTTCLSSLCREVGFSALGVMSLEGMLDVGITNVGGVDAQLGIQLFYNHVLPHLFPFPGPQSVLICDNAAIHHDPRIRQMVENVGAKIVFLPPYANNLDPIEEAFSKAKAWLERNRAHCVRDPEGALRTALMSVGHTDAAGYIRHAGYSVETLIPGVLYA